MQIESSKKSGGSTTRRTRAGRPHIILGQEPRDGEPEAWNTSHGEKENRMGDGSKSPHLSTISRARGLRLEEATGAGKGPEQMTENEPMRLWHDHRGVRTGSIEA